MEGVGYPLQYSWAPQWNITQPPWWLSSKESACNSGDRGSSPELGRSPGEGNGNPLQYFCLGNLMDMEAW